MKGQHFGVLIIAFLFIVSCSSESVSVDGNEEKHVSHVSTDPSAEVTGAEIAFLKVSDPDQFITELSNTCERIQSYVSDDNTNEVLLTHVFHKDREHLIFDQLKEVVQLNMIYMETKSVELAFRVSVRHKVKDFKTWKWLYDGNQKSQDQEGMVLLQMATVQGDPNEVFMIFAIPDIAKAKEMMKNPELRIKMKQGGVLGDPQIKFWRLPINS